METLLISLFVAAVSYFVNQGERARAKEDALDLQHDAQDYNSDQVSKSRDWQEDFYLKYQSPDSVQQMARKMGASESAALMSALGVSPSVASGPSASSGISSGLGAGVNTLSDLFNSISGGFNQFMQGQKTKEEIPYVAPLSEANIKSTLENLEIHWKEFGLQKDTFDNISVPMAQMAYDKSRQDIIESESRTLENFAKIDEIEQKIKESEQRIKESDARIDLYGATTDLTYEQVNTEKAKQTDLYSSASLKDSQNVGQDIQNELDDITLKMSKDIGLDVRLRIDQSALYVVGHDIKTLKSEWPDFKKAVIKTFDGLRSNFDYRILGRKGRDSVFEFSKKHFPLNNGAKALKDLENWINRNTRYGYE